MNINGIHFEQVEDRDGWLVACPDGDSYVLAEQARRINETGAAPDYYAVCGLFEAVEQYQIYLVPRGNPGQLVEDFEVSSHAAYYAMDAPTSVRSEVEAVHTHSPILPFFADSAGFKFGFQAPITPELLDFLERTLSAGIEPMVEEPDGSIRHFISREKHVHLWWD